MNNSSPCGRPSRDFLDAGGVLFFAIKVEWKFPAKAADLADELFLATVGSSDAHLLPAIGLGATGFAGRTAKELRIALESGCTQLSIQRRANAIRLSGGWAFRFLLRSAGWAAGETNWRN